MNSSRFSENIYKLATVFLDGLTPETVARFPESGLDAEAFFTVPDAELRHVLHLPKGVDFGMYRREEAVARARKEQEFMDRHGIRALYVHDADYPRRLLEISTPPKVLFVLGNPDLNVEHLVSVVGTRRCTQAGMDWCRAFVEELSPLFPDLWVVSGLAYGIDSVAHAAAIAAGRPTAAVLAHGLDTIYPAAHRLLAKDIIAKGGALISEYPSGVTPYRSRFLERNRIVASISDATVVVESEIKGGAMSTANTAFSYSRDVFAVPGRPSDTMSSGCNHLIRKNKAHILSNVTDFIEDMDWRPAGLKMEPRQRLLFPELEGDLRIVYDCIRFRREPMTPDAIHAATTLPIAKVMAALGELEFDGIVSRLSGNRYELA
ncbi:MAG: DNA-processing protein DprA [Muribaculaceae bacterium]|nr:DNA-processing protein DprA [Muribaculaceae bacterium]